MSDPLEKWSGVVKNQRRSQLRVKLGNALIEQIFSASTGSGHADGRTCGVFRVPFDSQFPRVDREVGLSFEVKGARVIVENVR